MGGVTDPKKHAPPSRYLAECDRSMLKDVGINRGEPPKLGASGAPSPWDGDVAYLLKQAPPICYHIKLGRSASKVSV